MFVFDDSYSKGRYQGGPDGAGEIFTNYVWGVSFNADTVDHHYKGHLNIFLSYL